MCGWRRGDGNGMVMVALVLAAVVMATTCSDEVSPKMYTCSIPSSHSQEEGGRGRHAKRRSRALLNSQKGRGARRKRTCPAGACVRG